MAKNKNKHPKSVETQTADTPSSGMKRWIPVLALLAVIGIGAVAMFLSNSGRTNSSSHSTTSQAPSSTSAPAGDQPKPASELVTMDVAKAVMVTVELDFGPKVPTIAQALTEVERRYQPDDGQGRTFAVLDAYGEPTADGKLHLSMHVSSEKSGGGQLVFKRTGEVLWRGKINPSSQPVQPKNLIVYLDNGKGSTITVDGSNNPSSIIAAKVKPGDLPVRDVWPDGEERELTFIYSACGCPVKVLAKRVGEKTVRTKDTPVIFPDDPAAVAVISKLMRW